MRMLQQVCNAECVRPGTLGFIAALGGSESAPRWRLLSSSALFCRYTDLMRDPDWRSLLGLRKRVLMAKSASVFSMGNAVQSISTNILKVWTQQQEQESSA